MVCSECTLLEMNNIYIVDLLHPNSRLGEGLIDKSVDKNYRLPHNYGLFIHGLFASVQKATYNEPIPAASTTLK